MTKQTDKSLIAVNTYNKIASIYTKQYFRDLSDTPYIDRFLKLLPKGAKILDVGCGPGQFAGYTSKKGFNVQGIELSKEMLNIAKKRVPDVHFKLMDMRKLKYKAKMFDGLLLAYSLIHIPTNEIAKTLLGLKRVLKNNGYILIIVQKGEEDKIVDEPLKKGEKTFINFFTKEKITNYLKKTNFKIVYQEEVEGNDPNSISDKFIYTIAQKIK